MLLLKSPYLPNPSLLAEFIRRKTYARIARKEEQGMTHQWFLLCGQASKEWLLKPQPAELRRLMPPEDRSWADPFLWKRGDDWFVFFEEWIFGRPHGHISVMQVSPDGKRLSQSSPVLVKNHHLSYPFLFEHEGILHMLPEGGAGRAIELYQCEGFPAHWSKRAVLMHNIQYADASLFKDGTRWWLFVTIKRGLFGLNRDLFLFWADTPITDRWTAHPDNPVVRSLTSARPAGRIFELGVKRFRPSQNCMVRYGHSLNVNEVLRLDSQHYKERLVTELLPDWDKDIRANHHIDWLDGMVVMDAQRLVPPHR